MRSWRARWSPSRRAWRMAGPRPSCSSFGVTYPTPWCSLTELYSWRTRASSISSSAGSVIVSRCGHSPLTWPNRVSIQAWSVGVWGRPWCCMTARAAMNSRVPFEVIWGMNVGHREQDRAGRIIRVEVEPLGRDELDQAFDGEGVLEDDLDLGGGLLDGHERVDPLA